MCRGLDKVFELMSLWRGFNPREIFPYFGEHRSDQLEDGWPTFPRALKFTDHLLFRACMMAQGRSHGQRRRFSSDGCC
jgi:hypothetical protein